QRQVGQVLDPGSAQTRAAVLAIAARGHPGRAVAGVTGSPAGDRQVCQARSWTGGSLEKQDPIVVVGIDHRLRWVAGTLHRYVMVDDQPGAEAEVIVTGRERDRRRA